MINKSQVEDHRYIEEDEIDLRELWQTILKGKKIIVTITLVIVTLTLVYALKLPNEYKSTALLIPTADDSKLSSLAGLGGLAAMAGVRLGGGGSMTPDIAFNSLINNYDFMKNFVINNKIVEHYNDKNVDANYVFALGFRGVYDLFRADPASATDEDYNYDEEVFDLIEKLQKNFSVSSDKETGLIAVSYNDRDRAYAPKMVNLFLKDASAYLVQNNLRIIDEKLSYFYKELETTDGFELRQSLSTMISTILQDKVMMQSKVYYQCDVLAAPSEAYIKDKTKPKRGLILIVSFVTSIILGILLVFFLNFIRDEKIAS